MADWKPIDTAPRDGTAILVFVPSKFDAGSVLPAAWADDDEEWQTVGCVYPDESYDVHPTHWMPIPAPPR